MPILCDHDTLVADTRYTLRFPHPFVARPRLPHGFRRLDVNKDNNIRVSSTLQRFTRAWAETYITAWGGTTVHSAITDVFVLAPADLEFLTGENMRDSTAPTSVRIAFERPFVTPPKVVVFFNHIDLDKDRNWRLETTATDIDKNEFTLDIETWGDTILYAAQACWIAYPEDRKHIFSTSVNTMDVRPPHKPQLQQSKAITFDKVEFWKDPTVFIALNYLDIDCKANLRINAYVNDVSRSDLVWHIDSWADTILYAAGASIIAFN